jgi:integrase/recombinase XerD
LGRTARYGWVLMKLGEWLAKDFDKADRKDIESLVGKIQLNENYKDWTKHLYKVTIKKFYKVLNGGEEYPSHVRWIKCNFKNSDRILPEEILTGEEVKKMIFSAMSMLPMVSE